MSTAVFLSFPAMGHMNQTLIVLGELVRRGERVIVFPSDQVHAGVRVTAR